MSRGRKSLTVEYDSVWQKYLAKNIGAYLQLIINGLVVSNNNNYKSNYKLLESILKEKGKSISKVGEDEKLFAIPDNWFWAKLSDVCEISTGNKDVNEGHPEGVYPFFTCAQEPLKSNTYSFDDDCILLPGNGANVGYVNRYSGKFELYQRTYCLHKINKSISADFLELYLRGFWKNNLGQQFGSGINYLRISNFTKFIIPIPPAEIQVDILNFIRDFEKNRLKTGITYFNSEIENQIISYHQSQINGAELSTELTHQLSLVKKLRQQLLQDAVQGKLVGQNPKDEPASDLLKKIKAEKQKLIAEKKLKKEKELPPINPEEIPFEIPENWVWCRLGDICTKIGSGSTPKGSNYSEKGIPFFRSQNIYDSGLVYEDIKFISDEVHKQMNGTIVIANDILLNITGGSMGRCALVGDDFDEGNVSQHVCIIRPLLVDNQFLHSIILSPFFQKFIFSSTTGAGREGLPKYNLEQFLIPLPPLSEQIRIVQKLDELMKYCNELEVSIKESESQNEKLLQQVLREALRKELVEF